MATLQVFPTHSFQEDSDLLASFCLHHPTRYRLNFHNNKSEIRLGRRNSDPVANADWT